MSGTFTRRLTGFAFALTAMLAHLTLPVDASAGLTIISFI